MSDEFRYDPETGSFRPKNSPPPRQPKKNGNDDWGAWFLIVFLFCSGLWPLGLIFLISKLKDGKKQTHRAPTAQSAPKAEPQKKTAAQRAKQTAKKAARSPMPTDKTARTLTIIGGILTAVFGIGLLSTIGEALAYGFLGYMWEDLFSIGGFLAAGLVTLFAGRRMKKRARRFARYLAIMGERDSVSIDELCTAAGKRRATVERDLDVMLDKGILGELAYYDEGRGMLYRSAGARSAEVLREQQEKQAREQLSKKEEQPAEGDYNGYLAAIRRANDRIPDKELSDKMDRMEEIARKIFREIEEHPEKKQQAAKFLDYYLPTTLKLLETYADFDEAGVEGENLRQAKNRIETIMDSLVAGFEHQLDELYRSEAMDVDSDIRVMESMLRRDTATVADDFGLGSAAAVRRFPDEE